LRLRLLLLLALLSSTALGATGPGSPQGIFAEANARYQAGDFEQAEKLYLELVQSGVNSGTVFYNLGNACFKLKKLGESIYWWEKAKTRLPDDPDIRENLEFANLMLIDRIEVPPVPLPIRLLDRTIHFLPADIEFGIALGLFVAANVLFALYLGLRLPTLSTRAFTGAAVLAALAFLFASSAGWQVYEAENRRQGIVVEQKSDVRSGPGNENITVVTVHEGTKFRVRGEANGWVQISLPNGWSGWLPRTSVRIL
jgi:tetratricopeptide (TPR) repeat protein